MKSRLVALWQRNKRNLLIVAITTVCIGLPLLIFLGYLYQWTWTGFNALIGPKVQQYQPSKTLWDWMQLLIIPAALTIAALLFNSTTSRNEQEIATERSRAEHDIALDNQRENLLQAYLDRMSELLLGSYLSTSEPSDQVRSIIRARTLTILTKLDGTRKGNLLKFLYESRLINMNKGSSIIHLSGGNLSNAGLSNTNLSSADLSNANLSSANLSNTNLSGAFAKCA